MNRRIMNKKIVNRRIVNSKLKSNKWLVFVVLFTIHCSLFTSPTRAQIGTWRNYLAYSEIQQIREAGSDNLFVLASNGLYQYNKQDQSIHTYDKTNGLSDTYITKISWCPQAKRLIAVYENSNIDLVDLKGNVTNISDLYNKLMTGDKTVNSIRIDGIYAYLVCGFGIVKVNMQRAEIAESYTPNHPDYPTSLPAEDNSDYDKYIELVKTLKPEGPKYNYFYSLRFLNNKLYSCGGLYHPLIDLNRPGTVQILDKSNNWTICEDQLESITNHQYVDVDCIDVDPADDNHVFAGGRTGLYEFRNGKFVRDYNYDNSELKSTFSSNPNKNYVIVQAIKFDNEGKLWVIQSLNKKNKLLVLHKDGSWTKKDYNLFNTYGSSLGENNVLGNARNIIFDSNNTLWFAHDHFDTPAIYSYDNSSNTSKEYSQFVNQDGATITVSEGVRCVVEDKQRNLWIATSSGPLMLERSEIDKNGTTFTQVKVPRNDGTNYADYLLSGLDITSIAIDGGNRKWFGTNNNGVYLISSDNMVQIQHFTKENSPLLSNNIFSIAINPTSGEVFFGTDYGLCSYVSDATETNTEMTTDNVWAYPNPVEPGYFGSITITGLSMNADVKILSANGAIINEGRSNGGMYVWDGCDQKGNRVASGIYMVATATSTGEKGTVCKIAIIR